MKLKVFLLFSWSVFHFVLGRVLKPQAEAKSKLTFWQISDIHLDTLYSVNGDPTDFCHDHESKNNSSSSSNNKEAEYHVGKFGSFKCEANWDLVTSALEFMVKEEPDPGKNKINFLYKSFAQHFCASLKII